MPTLRIALAQLNLTVGDLAGNQAKVLDALQRARAWLADLVVVPELALTGYPPEDLLLKPQFVEKNLRMLRPIARDSRGVAAIVGYVDRDRAGRLYNAAAVLAGGRQVATYHKRLLPNYGVFDEQRYFTPGTRPLVISVRGVRVGLSICEDLWQPRPVRELAQAGAQLLVNISASPYYARKLFVRQRLFAHQAKAHRLAVAYCNLVGGQDELVFDGASLVLDVRGRVRSQAAQFQEDFLVLDLEARDLGSRRMRVAGAGQRPPLPMPSRRALPPVQEEYEALTLGLRDYVQKNGFTRVVLGLSGGIDSSLTACLAADALGAKRVVGVVMPSRYSSATSQADAGALARALGIELRELSIEPMFRVFLRRLRPIIGTHPGSVPEQNLQARIRGMLLMALSNAFGWLVLTTGDKSEMATGYTTLYGDMAGGFAVIKDVPKTLVYRLARYRNTPGRAGGAPIPARIFRRPPSPELAPHQRAQDTLPPYPVLDRILQAYVEEDVSLRSILQRNQIDPAVARRVIRMVDRSEYKRRQGPPGVKITPKAFGKDRRMPITNRYQQN